MHLIVQLLTLFTLCYAAEGSMCYFCQDTTEASGRNQCQTWYKTMNYYRKKFINTKKFSTDKYVKNCTQYGGDQGKSLCMVGTIHQSNNVRSFIRDCTDGVTFFSQEMDLDFRTTVLNDNQTSCHYTGQGYLVCVTVCDPLQHGDFCNGFVMTASQTRCLPNVLLIMSLLFGFFLKNALNFCGCAFPMKGFEHLQGN